MTHVTLGPRPVIAIADTTGSNAGNWTATLDQSVMRITQPNFEMYHMYIQSPVLSTTQTTATVKLNESFWDATLIGQLNSWDPSQPMILTPSDVIYVFFNVPTSQTPAPIVTCWFRYEQ